MKTSIHMLVQKVEATAEEKRQRICGNKIPHESFEIAERWRDSAEARFGWAMNTYQCGYCNKWHIGRASKL